MSDRLISDVALDTARDLVSQLRLPTAADRDRAFHAFAEIVRAGLLRYCQLKAQELRCLRHGAGDPGGN